MAVGGGSGMSVSPRERAAFLQGVAAGVMALVHDAPGSKRLLRPLAMWAALRAPVSVVVATVIIVSDRNRCHIK